MKVVSEQEMLDFGAKVARELDVNVIELVGDVGVGKTTFVRGFAKGLGVKEPVTSPSFTISKSYATGDGRVLTHYDFYRLGDVGLMKEDLDEKLTDPSQIVVIEWGEAVKNLLPENHATIEVRLNDDGSRDIIMA